VDLLQKKGGVDPQLHGFHEVPQEVLHQIQVSWSWAKLPTTATNYRKKWFVLFFLSFPAARTSSSPCRSRASPPRRGRARPTGGEPPLPAPREASAGTSPCRAALGRRLPARPDRHHAGSRSRPMPVRRQLFPYQCAVDGLPVQARPRAAGAPPFIAPAPLPLLRRRSSLSRSGDSGEAARRLGEAVPHPSWRGCTAPTAPAWSRCPRPPRLGVAAPAYTGEAALPVARRGRTCPVRHGRARLRR
jgi:hypothetical protein